MYSIKYNKSAYCRILYLDAHNPIRSTIKAFTMTIFSQHAFAPLTKEVNNNRLASVYISVTASNPVCSIVDSSNAGSIVPERAMSACACRIVYMVSRT